jgi:hypothetical protein
MTRAREEPIGREANTATRAQLDRLLRPRSIALVGASAKSGARGRILRRVIPDKSEKASYPRAKLPGLD